MATAMLSVGLLGISAPAHADWSWYIRPPLTRSNPFLRREPVTSPHVDRLRGSPP